MGREDKDSVAKRYGVDEITLLHWKYHVITLRLRRTLIGGSVIYTAKTHAE